MKSLLLIPLCSLCLWANAQETKQRLALVASPDLSFFAGHKRANAQLPRLGFRVRVDGEIQLEERLWLRIGVGYALMRYKEKIDTNSLQWPNQHNGNGGFNPNSPGESLENPYLLTQDEMIIVPVALRWYWTKRFYSDLEGGANFIFTKGSDMVVRPNAGVAFGWQTPISRHSFFFLQPAFRFVFNYGLPKTLASYTVHPYSIGLETGIRGLLK